MFQTDQPTAVSSLPTPATAGTQGFFTGGNPGSGQPATIVDADFLNMIQQELINVVEAGGETPSKTTYNQVLLAIQALIAQPQTNKVSGVVGSVRNLAMSVAAASSTATATADEIIVETALGGLRYCLPSFSETINLATTAAGGMDTGTAPNSSYVGIYAIWNPTTSTAALLATNASAKLPNVYGAGHMPTGYTASALLTVVPTNSSGQFAPVQVIDRWVDAQGSQFLSTSTQASTATAVTSTLPPNARRAKILVGIDSTSASTNSWDISGNAQMVGESVRALTGVAGSDDFSTAEINLSAAPTIYYVATASVGTMGLLMSSMGYQI